MICSKCNTELSLQDVRQSKWKKETEIFSIICPICNTKNKIIVNLFENEHINDHYLALLSQDCGYCQSNSEKFIDYIPKNNKNKLLKHLTNCKICQDRLESIRLADLSEQNTQNINLFNFFLKKSTNIIQELIANKDVVLKNDVVKSFVFKNKTYNLKKMFYEFEENKNGIKMKKKCYIIDSKDIVLGITLFTMSNEKIILEKIWLKNEKTVKEERKMLKNIKNGKIKIFLKNLVKTHRN